ncbi:hypothetical protein BDR04DRAFT_45047 [Suillus decipiens]|nr:hypothetical protein BDR04DRAFT_45047 [Suillus decipiens]
MRFSSVLIAVVALTAAISANGEADEVVEVCKPQGPNCPAVCLHTSHCSACQNESDCVFFQCIPKGMEHPS